MPGARGGRCPKRDWRMRLVHGDLTIGDEIMPSAANTFRSSCWLVEGKLWVMSCKIGVAAYDFDFTSLFECRTGSRDPVRLDVVARVGAIPDYSEQHGRWLGEGIQLVHSPQQHFACSELPMWYERIPDLTPKSMWFTEPPDAREVGDALGWPVFIRGSRQTSRHQRALAIARDVEEFRRAMDAYRQDAILNWQRIVCRSYARLRPVEDRSPDRIPSSFEFRSFWWETECVGFGRYWTESAYTASAKEKAEALAVGADAASRIDGVFKAIDLGQTVDGRWIVIESNDGQESGYAGINPISLWRRTLYVIDKKSRLRPTEDKYSPE